MPFRELWVPSADGLKLKTYLYNTRRNVPAVIMCHGFTGNSSGPLGSKVAEALSVDYLMCRFDFRGQGESEGRFYGSSITWELEDLAHVVSYVRAEYSPSKIILLGHSFGAAIAMLYAAEHSADALVLLSGEGDLQKGICLEFSSEQLRELETSGATNVINWSKGGELDLLGRQFLDDMRRYSTVDAAKRITCPTLLVHGTADDVVPPSYSEEMHRYIRNSDFVLVDNAAHVYNEYTEKPSKVPEVIALVHNWLGKSI